MLLVVMADYFSTFLKSDTIVGVEVKSSSETEAALDDYDTLIHTSSPSFPKVNLRIVTQVKIFWTGYKENFGANLSPDSLGV